MSIYDSRNVLKVFFFLNKTFQRRRRIGRKWKNRSENVEGRSDLARAREKGQRTCVRTDLITAQRRTKSAISRKHREMRGNHFATSRCSATATTHVIENSSVERTMLFHKVLSDELWPRNVLIFLRACIVFRKILEKQNQSGLKSPKLPTYEVAQRNSGDRKAALDVEMSHSSAERWMRSRLEYQAAFSILVAAHHIRHVLKDITRAAKANGPRCITKTFVPIEPKRRF